MRILFLAFDFPYPPDSGGRIKTFSILDYLRDSGHQVSVVCFRRRPLSAEQGRWAEGRGAIESVPLERGRSIGNLLRSYANRVPLSIERNRSEKMKELVRRRTQAGAFDRLFVDGWMMAQYVPEGFRGRTILHEHNAEYVLWRRQAQRERNPLRRALVQLEYRRVRRCEARILRRFDTVFAVSEDDAGALEAIGAERSRLRVLPNLPDQHLLGRPALSFAESGPAILYFGTLSWQPNIEGLERLMREVLPAIRRSLPEAKLLLAGQGAPPSLQRLARTTPGVEFLGQVDDSETLYRRARVFVEATRSGGGTKLKVLNSLARGLPIAASPEAVAGLDVTPGEHLLVASDSVSLAASVVSLLTDEALWGRLSENGRALIRSRYTPETAFGVLDDVLSGDRAPA